MGHWNAYLSVLLSIPRKVFSIPIDFIIGTFDELGCERHLIMSKNLSGVPVRSERAWDIISAEDKGSQIYWQIPLESEIREAIATKKKPVDEPIWILDDGRNKLVRYSPSQDKILKDNAEDAEEENDEGRGYEPETPFDCSSGVQAYVYGIYIYDEPWVDPTKSRKTLR